VVENFNTRKPKEFQLLGDPTAALLFGPRWGTSVYNIVQCNKILFKISANLERKSRSKAPIRAFSHLISRLLVQRCYMRFATQSAVMPQHVVCPSIRPFVTFWYRDHIGLYVGIHVLRK